MMNPKYPQVLFEIQSFLQSQAFQLQGGSHEDGRVVSLAKEDVIRDALMSNFDCVKGKNRQWFDIAITSESGEMNYCNIKISSGETPDNAFQKKGIVHSLTNLHESRIPGSMSINEMHRLLMNHPLVERDYEREYYFIYIDKKDNTVIIRSLCDIEHFVPNSCNYLQIAWKKEKQRKDIDQHCTSIEQIRNKICCIISESIQRGIDSSCDLVQAYPTR